MSGFNTKKADLRLSEKCFKKGGKASDEKLLNMDSCIKQAQNTICELIIDVLAQEFELDNYIYNDENQSIEFHVYLNSIRINICIIYSGFDNMISISAVYFLSNKSIDIYNLASIITKYNSSAEYTPLGKVKLDNNVKAVIFENQYICKSVVNFDREDFMTYFSATVLSAEKIIKEIKNLI